MRIVVTVDDKSTVTPVAKPVGVHRPTATTVPSSRWSAILGVAHCVTCVVMHIHLSLFFSVSLSAHTLSLSLSENTSKTHFLVCLSLSVSAPLSFKSHVVIVFVIFLLHLQYCSCQYDVLYSLAMCTVVSQKRILNLEGKKSFCLTEENKNLPIKQS